MVPVSEIPEYNLHSLPSIPLSERDNLPRKRSGIYLVADAVNVVHYIGQTCDLRKRFRNHHRWKDFEVAGCVKILYLLAPLIQLDVLEVLLIYKFQPSLNGGSRLPKRGKSIYHKRIEETPCFGDRRRKTYVWLATLVDLNGIKTKSYVHKTREGAIARCEKLDRTEAYYSVSRYLVEEVEVFD